MADGGDMDLIWWVSAVEIPTLAGMLWLLFRFRGDGQQALESVERRADRLRDGLANFKLDVARTYASISELKDVEQRLTEHLVRIEAKLDQAVLKSLRDGS